MNLNWRKSVCRQFDRLSVRKQNITSRLAGSVAASCWQRKVGSDSAASRSGQKEARMRYKVKNVAALQTLLGSWPDRMQVEIDPGIRVSAKTVGELRKVTAWPENLAITTPSQRSPESTIKVSKATVPTRVSPKP